MKIITVANHKGGVGKTTTAVTLAHLLHLDGRAVSVLDLDAPAGDKAAGAAQALRRARALGIEAATVDDMAEGATGSWVVVDTPPDLADETTRATFALSDVVVVPTGTAPEEVEVACAAVEDIAAELRMQGAYVLVVLTRVPAWAQRVEAEARETLAAACDGLRARVARATIPALSAVPKAAARGSTVAEGRFTTDRRAAAAYAALLAEIEEGY